MASWLTAGVTSCVAIPAVFTCCADAAAVIAVVIRTRIMNLVSMITALLFAPGYSGQLLCAIRAGIGVEPLQRRAPRRDCRRTAPSTRGISFRSNTPQLPGASLRETGSEDPRDSGYLRSGFPSPHKGLERDMSRPF